MHLLISPGVHASPQPRTEITGMWMSDIRSQVLVPGQQAMRPSSHPWHTHFQLLPTDSRCVSASLLAATCHHSIGSLHSQPRCSKPGKQLQTHRWDTRNTAAAAERMLGTQSQGTHTSWMSAKSGLQVGYSNQTKFTGKSMTQGCTADTVIEERAQ